MDTDPNPFRESPDSDRSSSSTEAIDDTTRDFAEISEEDTSSGSSPMSEDDDNDSSADDSSTDTDDSSTNGTSDSATPDPHNYNEKGIAGEPRPV